MREGLKEVVWESKFWEIYGLIERVGWDIECFCVGEREREREREREIWLGKVEKNERQKKYAKIQFTTANFTLKSF